MASHITIPERRNCLASVVAHALLMLLCVQPAWGQETLDIIDSIASKGDVERARSILEGWWEADLQDANRHDRQYALWLRGLLTVDPELASLDFRRLTVSFPGGPYSDDALFRLGLISLANGDLLEASAYFRAILLDYPISPKRKVAEEWLNSNQSALEVLELARIPKIREQVQAIQKNTKSLSQASGGASGRYAIQVGAFSNSQRARDLAKELSAKGFEVRVVGIKGTALSRVRIGRFKERQRASTVLQHLREIGQVATLVDDVFLEIERP